MLRNYLAILGSLAILIVYKLISILFSRRRHAIQAKKLGCQPPPQNRPEDIFGITTLKYLEGETASDMLLTSPSQTRSTPNFDSSQMTSVHLAAFRELSQMGADLPLRPQRHLRQCPLALSSRPTLSFPSQFSRDGSTKSDCCGRRGSPPCPEDRHVLTDIGGKCE